MKILISLLMALGFNLIIIQVNAESYIQPVTIQAHDGGVYSIATRPDGCMLASGGADKKIKLWDLKSGRLIKSIDAHNDIVYSLDFSPDGQTLLSGSLDGAFKLWTIPDAIQIPVPKAEYDSGNPNTPITSVAFHPNGKEFAVGGFKSPISIYSFETLKKERRLKNHYDEAYYQHPYSIAYNIDGSLLLFGSIERKITLWSSKTGALIRSHDEHKDTVSAVAFSPDSQVYASGSFDKSMKIWSVVTGETIITHDDHSGWISSIDYSTDGRLIASGCWDPGEIFIWEPFVENPLAKLTCPNGVSKVVFSLDDSMIIAGCLDGNIYLWFIAGIVKTDLKQPKATINENLRLDGSVKTYYLEPDIVLLKLRDKSDYSVYSPSWKIKNYQRTPSEDEILLMDRKEGYNTNHLSAICFSSDSMYIAISGWFRGIDIIEFESGKFLRNFPEHWACDFLAFSSDDSKLVIRNQRDEVKILSSSDGMILRSFQNEQDKRNFYTFAIDPDSNIITTYDGELFRWSISSGEKEKIWKFQSYKKLKSFLPYNNFVAIYSDDNYDFYNISDWKEIGSIKVKNLGVQSGAIDPNGKIFAQTYTDGISFYSFKTKKHICDLKDGSEFQSVSWSPNGRYIATIDEDKIKIWIID